MISYGERPATKNEHLPPWRIGVCLLCQHCFDAIEHERCTRCESKQVASLDTILDNWEKFRKGHSAA